VHRCPEHYQPMRILIIKLSSMGDTLHALPTVAALKEHLGAEIDWAVQPGFAPLVRCFAPVERVLLWPRRGSWQVRRQALKELRAERYDLVIDLQGLLKSALVARLARAGRRIGPSFHREGAFLFYDLVAGRRNKQRHAVEECMDVLDLLDMPRPAIPQFPLNLPEIDLAPAPDAVRRVALAPLSRWPSKNWPLTHFAALARRLVGDCGVELHAIGGPDDAAAVEEIAQLAQVPILNHCGSYSLAESGSLLRRMDLLVTNDSGPMHLGAAVGTPCVALFGPTLPDRTGPYGPGHRVLRLDNCPPCRSRDCRRASRICLEDMPPDMVFEAVRKVLAARG